MSRLLPLAAASILFFNSAATQTWKSDAAHSRVSFGVSYMMLSEVTGRFTEFEATLAQGKEDFSGSSVNATIAVKSINTDNEGRDKHLRSDDFFNAEKFPAITFVSTSFVKTGEKAFRITGNLTMRDVTKEVVLDATFAGSITDPRGNTRVGFKATGVVNRQDFGVKWNRTLDAGGVVAGDEVNVTLLLQFLKQK
jgi:polyisoprenoid-binding protein YceI